MLFILLGHAYQDVSTSGHLPLCLTQEKVQTLLGKQPVTGTQLTAELVLEPYSSPPPVQCLIVTLLLDAPSPSDPVGGSLFLLMVSAGFSFIVGFALFLSSRNMWSCVTTDQLISRVSFSHYIPRV